MEGIKAAEMADSERGRTPPGKRHGQGKGPRRIAGEIIDIATAAKVYGGTPAFWRARVSRRQVPFRKFGGRIVFLRRELDAYFGSELTGCPLEEALTNEQARRAS